MSERKSYLAAYAAGHAAGLREAQAAGDPALREALEWVLFALNWEVFRPIRWSGEVCDIHDRLTTLLAASQPAAAPRETLELMAARVAVRSALDWLKHDDRDAAIYDLEGLSSLLAPAAASAEPREETE